MVDTTEIEALVGNQRGVWMGGLGSMTMFQAWGEMNHRWVPEQINAVLFGDRVDLG
jgi:hypothetical protein